MSNALSKALGIYAVLSGLVFVILWETTFSNTVTLGEAIQIVLLIVVAVIVPLGIFGWRWIIKKWPLRVRQRVNGDLRAEIVLAGERNPIRLVLFTRVDRRCGRFQLELAERDWRTWFGIWRTTDSPNISIGEGDIQPIHGIGTAMIGRGYRVDSFGPDIECAKGEMAVIDIVVTCNGPWRGCLLVESSAQREATTRTSIPIVAL